MRGEMEPDGGRARRMGALAVLWGLSIASAVRLCGLPLWRALVEGMLMTLAIAGCVLAGDAIARRRRARGEVRRASGVVLVGRRESLHRAIAAGPEVLGGRPEALLVDGTREGAARVRGVPVIDPAEFERTLSGGARGGVVLVPPLSPSLAAWVQARAAQAGVPCAYAGALAPSLPAMRELAAHAPAVLLGRVPDEEIHDEHGPRITEAVSGRAVLIVGAGGSLGREVARRLLRHRPARVVLADASENGLHAAAQELRSLGAAAAGPPIVARLLRPEDPESVTRLLASTRPEVLVHAGGRRHVALAEDHPADTALANVGGTRAIVDAVLEAPRGSLRRVVFVSTCAAVAPRGVLGATHRLLEQYVQHAALRLAGQPDAPRLVVVRLPNLLGAAASVLPLLEWQLVRGLPLTITHPDAERHFATVPEAAERVLESLVLGDGGDLLIPDVGRPVRILDLAGRLCTAAGLRLGADVPLSFIGLRPGERLQEPMSGSDEPVAASRDPSTWVVRAAAARDLRADSLFLGRLDRLTEAARAGDDGGVVRALVELLPDYRPSAEQEWRHLHVAREATAPTAFAAHAAQVTGGGGAGAARSPLKPVAVFVGRGAAPARSSAGGPR